MQASCSTSLSTLLPQPESMFMNVDDLTPADVLSSKIDSIDDDQFLDIYDLEIAEALRIIGIAGLAELREHQASAIVHAIKGDTIFLSLATGAGKSLCFQMPAILVSRSPDPRVTVVIQPTLEIIQSQVRALALRGVSVEILSSLSSHEERNLLVHRLRDHYRPALLYTTADTFVGNYDSVFLTLYREKALARIVLDEAHTILHWADFKPSMVGKFLNLRQHMTLKKHIQGLLTKLKDSYAGIPITISTASLTLDDRATLLSHLSIPAESCCVISGSLDRPNIVYTVQPVHSTHHNCKMKLVTEFLLQQTGTNPAEASSGLVYCSTASHCVIVVDALNKHYGDGYSAAVYGEKRQCHGRRHGQELYMDRTTQREVVKSWIDGRKKVLVATIAFGMGIDKRDVRFIIHYDLPQSLENYIQETGRAGRDGQLAKCLLLYSWQDVQRTLFYAEKQEQPGQDVTTSKVLAMSRYAYETRTCRHVQILDYFGSRSANDQVGCVDKCDNCASRSQSAHLTVTEIARTLVGLIREVGSAGACGFNRIVNTVCGSTAKDVVPTQGGYYCTIRRPRAQVKAVLAALLAHGILRGVPVRKGKLEENWGPHLRFMYGVRSLDEIQEDTRSGRQMVLHGFNVQGSGWSGESEEVTNEEDVSAHGVSPAHTAAAKGKAREIPLLGVRELHVGVGEHVIDISSEGEGTNPQVLRVQSTTNSTSFGGSPASPIDISSSDDEPGSLHMPLGIARRDPTGSNRHSPTYVAANLRSDWQRVAPQVPLSAIRYMEDERRKAYRQCRIMYHLSSERDVLSDCALASLAVEKPTDPLKFIKVLRACGEPNPEEKWMRFGPHFRRAFTSSQFESAVRSSARTLGTSSASFSRTQRPAATPDFVTIQPPRSDGASRRNGSHELQAVSARNSRRGDSHNSMEDIYATP